MTYNGYVNYETWAVCLWIDNNEGLYLEAREVAQEPEMEAYRLASYLENMVDMAAPELEASVYSDLLNNAISNVDWVEVANHFIEE